MVDAVALLDRAPAPVRRLAYRIADGEGVLGRLADRFRFRFDEADIPALPAVREATTRLFIGPANSAGQGYEWARAVERNLADAAAVSMRGLGSSPFDAAVDLTVPVAVYQRSAAWHAALEEYLRGRTHVIWESGRPLLGREYGVADEIRRITGSGVRGALIFHGSDIRPPSRHAASNPWSPFASAAGPVHALEDEAARNAALAAGAGLPVFVSTPDQLQWLPDATWCPVVIDPARWRVPARPATDGPPVVAHAPSQPWLKGTDRIEPMLRRLAAEGLIEYRQIVGVPHAAMPEFYAGVDIVLDQFLLGSYGVAACEALASGRLVMGHVDAATRDAVRTLTGLELPVHEATVDSLERELRRAVAEPEAFAATRAAAPLFVEAVHDGRRSAAALAPFLGFGTAAD